MSELKMVSPLLDRMTVENESDGNNNCYTLRHTLTGERFILKRLSVPASEKQINALILSGAYTDEAAVHSYYGGVVSDIKAELDVGRELSASGCFAGAVSYQVEPKESGVGYDVYILYPLYVPLSDFLKQSAMTNLRAVNLGIDLCDALSVCRDAGYLFGNIKPENIYFVSSGKFLLGDLGLVPLQDLKYACMPESYIGAFSAPELSDITASPNPTVDLYSLGMVLYRVYNGGHGPFEDEHTGEAMADKLRLTGKTLPSPIYADYELATIILKACAFKREDRYQSPEELKQALVLYMQRNEVSDTLIVPPIVSAPELIADVPESEPEEEAPMHMTDAEQLDENFRQSFAPDLSGAGTEQDIDPTAASAVSRTEREVPKAAEPETPDIAPPRTNSSEVSLSEDPDFDPDQLDIDALLASVSEYVGDAQEKDDRSESINPDEQTHDYIDDQEKPTEPPAKGKKKIGKVLLITALLLVIAAAGYFLWNWYYVDVSNLNVISCTPQEMAIELISDESQDCFVLSCTDSYGNAYPGTLDGDAYTFTGLSEKTTYTVTVAAAEHHKLSAASTYTLSVTTPEITEITEFTAVRGESDGEVLLSFVQEGPAPATWKLSYTDADGTETGSFEFDGNAYLVSGLQQDKVYTFTLENTDDIFLAGQVTAQYQLLPIVEAKNLNISEIRGNDVTVVWEAGENQPDEWTVTCEAEGFSTSETAAEPSCTFTLPDFSRDYTISVTAAGMDMPEALLFPSDPIVVENLAAAVNEDGSVTVTWDTPAGSPEGGWYVSYNTVGSYHAAYILNSENAVIDGNSATLDALIPNAEYEISLTASDTSASVFGTLQTRVTTPEATAFDEYSVNPAPPLSAASGYTSLWVLPEQQDWDYTNLRNTKTTFAADEKIAVCMEINSTNASSDTVTLLYVIRDSEGKAVNDVSQELEWNSVWYSRRHAGQIPLPAGAGEDSTPGSYTLEIYINGKLLSSIGFTVA